jgi:hypothetical protein
MNMPVLDTTASLIGRRSRVRFSGKRLEGAESDQF